MHKFLLAENPQAPTGGLWIVHLIEPVSILEAVLDGEKVYTKKALYTKDFTYLNPDGDVELWQLRIHHYFSTNMEDMHRAEVLAAKMLTDAWHWFKAYLIWEDENIENI